MVERYVDKKIRALQEILKASTSETLDDEGRPHPCKYLSTEGVKIPYELLVSILHHFKLTIISKQNLKEIFGNTDDYLIEIIVEDEDSKRLSALLKEYQSQFPKRKKPLIRERTLELISQKIGNLDTGNNLVKFLKNCGVDEELIVYPNTKWRMILGVLVYLANSNKDDDKDTFSRVIGEATHPLMHGGDASAANVLREEFNNYLRYDNFGIGYDESDGSYLALRKMDEGEANIHAQIEEDEMISHYEEKSEKQLKFLSNPENKERISLLRKAYQALMSVVSTFCENPAHPTVELNENYQFLNKLITSTINELGLWQIETTPFSRNKHFFHLQFSNLFSAEKVYQERGEKISWQMIRPAMNAMYGDIEEFYLEVNGSDVLAEPDKQKKLNEIQLYLSELKEKTMELKEKNRDRLNQRPITKIEITSMPELRIKGLEEKIVLPKSKNKRIQLRKFPSDLKWEEISIQFLNEHEVIIKARNETFQANYELMGFQDEKRKLPNKQWSLLIFLAMKNGEVSWENTQNLPIKQINSIKKQKQLLSEALKTYFQITNDEPFYDYKKEGAYKIKFNAIPESKDTS